MAEQHAGKQRIGFIQQSKASNHWAAPGTASSNFKLLNYDKGVSISDPDVQIDQQNFINQRGIVNEYERIYVDAKSGLPTLPFSGVATRSVLAPHFVAALQAVTEGDLTPFAKTITSAFKSGVVDWSANEGYLWTLINDRKTTMGTDGDTTILENALLDTFQFTIEPDNRGIARLAKISGIWIGRTSQTGSSYALSGTLTEMPTTNFYNDATKFTLNLNIGGIAYTDVCFKRFTLRIENNITSDCKGAGGLANNFKASPKYFVDIGLPYLSAYNLFSSDFVNGVAAFFDLETGTPGATGHLKIDCDSGDIVQNPFGFDGEYMSRPLVIELLSKSGDAQTPIEVTISDAVDWAY